MPNQKSLRWGILGTGMIAKKFAGDLPHSNSGVLAGAASRSMDTAQSFADEFGGEAFEGYDSLLSSEDIDAVYISLPNILHREWTEKSLSVGKHVLCEKPMALNSEDARAMFAHAEKCDRVLIEAFMYRAHPQTQKLFDLVADGAIGDLQLIRTNFTFSREASKSDARYQADAGGGSLMDVGCYCTDFIRTLAGAEPSGMAAFPHIHELGVDDYAVGTLSFDSGLLATFTCGMTVVSDQSAHIAGTKGRIEIMRFWQGKEGFTLVRPNGDTEFFAVEEPRPIYAVEADAFADVVFGAVNWNPPENTINNMKVLDELRKPRPH